eukprot:gene10571-10730_t
MQISSSTADDVAVRLNAQIRTPELGTAAQSRRIQQEIQMKADNAYATGLETAMAMAGIALHVKNAALDLLAQELHALRRENELLVKVATASGGDQVPQLLQSLHLTEAELDQANQRLQEEVEIREGLERELEDTAAAAQELWESMQAACTLSTSADVFGIDELQGLGLHGVAYRAQRYLAAQLKLSPRGGLATGGSTVPAAASDGTEQLKAVAASMASEARQGDIHWEKDA